MSISKQEIIDRLSNARLIESNLRLDLSNVALRDHRDCNGRTAIESFHYMQGCADTYAYLLSVIEKQEAAAARDAAYRAQQSS
jgi:hypothetical protein